MRRLLASRRERLSCCDVLKHRHADSAAVAAFLSVTTHSVNEAPAWQGEAPRPTLAASSETSVTRRRPGADHRCHPRAGFPAWGGGRESGAALRLSIPSARWGLGAIGGDGISSIAKSSNPTQHCYRSCGRWAARSDSSSRKNKRTNAFVRRSITPRSASCTLT